jgi:hypothetical protein
MESQPAMLAAASDLDTNGSTGRYRCRSDIQMLFRVAIEVFWKSLHPRFLSELPRAEDPFRSHSGMGCLFIRDREE